MDIISDAGSIGRVVVVAKDRDVLAVPRCDLQHQGNEMGFRGVVLTSRFTGPRGIEIPQACKAQTLGLRQPVERSLKCPFGFTVGAPRRNRCLLIPLVLQVAAGHREHITIFGDDYDTPDGTCIRDYIHVVDLAEAHILALQALEQGDRVYNLGNGEGFSVRQVIETARAVTGATIPEQRGTRRAGDPARLVASSDRIRDELGWAPQFPALEQIIDSAWRWHQRHPDGYPD